MPEVKAPAPYKPGYRTTEFWVTLSSNAVTVLTMLGYINPGDQKGVDQAVNAIIVALFSLVMNVLYVYTRLVAKRQQ